MKKIYRAFLSFFLFIWILPQCTRKNLPQTHSQSSDVKAVESFQEKIKFLYHDSCLGVVIENRLGMWLTLMDGHCLGQTPLSLTKLKSTNDSNEHFLIQDRYEDESTKLQLFILHAETKITRCERTMQWFGENSPFTEMGDVKLFFLESKKLNYVSCKWLENTAVMKSFGLLTVRHGSIDCPTWPKTPGVFVVNNHALLGFYRPNENKNIITLMESLSLKNTLERFSIQIHKKSSQTCEYALVRHSP